MLKTAFQIGNEVLVKISSAEEEAMNTLREVRDMHQRNDLKYQAAARESQQAAETYAARNSLLKGLGIASALGLGGYALYQLANSEPKTASQISNEVLRKLAYGGMDPYAAQQMDPSYYEEPAPKKRRWPAAVIGAGVGGLGAHYLLPNQMVKDYRAAASSIADKAKASEIAHKPHYDALTDTYKKEIPGHNVTVKDISAEGRPLVKKMPAHMAQKYLKSRAWAESMPRTLLGAGLGLGAGILAANALD